MNRRNFIQTLAAAGVSVALPIKLVTDAIHCHKFTRQTQLSDYDSTRILGVQAKMDGRRHGLVKAIKEWDWVNMTGAQREATWRRLELLALEIVSAHQIAA